jgi:hypothetical protein
MPRSSSAPNHYGYKQEDINEKLSAMFERDELERIQREKLKSEARKRALMGVVSGAGGALASALTGNVPGAIASAVNAGRSVYQGHQDTKRARYNLGPQEESGLSKALGYGATAANLGGGLANLATSGAKALFSQAPSAGAGIIKGVVNNPVSTALIAKGINPMASAATQTLTSGAAEGGARVLPGILNKIVTTAQNHGIDKMALKQGVQSATNLANKGIEGYYQGKDAEISNPGVRGLRAAHTLGALGEGAGQEFSRYAQRKQDSAEYQLLKNRDIEGLEKSGNQKLLQKALGFQQQDAIQERQEKMQKEKLAEKEKAKLERKAEKAVEQQNKIKLAEKKAATKASRDAAARAEKKAGEMSELYPGLTKSQVSERQALARTLGIDKDYQLYNTFMEGGKEMWDATMEKTRFGGWKKKKGANFLRGADGHPVDITLEPIE